MKFVFLKRQRTLTNVREHIIAEEAHLISAQPPSVIILQAVEEQCEFCEAEFHFFETRRHKLSHQRGVGVRD